MQNVLQLLVLTLLIVLVGCDSGDPTSQGGPVAMKRLTPAQYRNAVEDLFGPRTISTRCLWRQCYGNLECDKLMRKRYTRISNLYGN